MHKPSKSEPGGFTVTEQTPPATDGPPPGLTWGIKQSFMRYLGAIDDSSIGLGDGASLLEVGAFNFVFGSSAVDHATGSGTFDFRGTVEISAHGGMLALNLRNPRVVVAASGATLSVDDTSGNTADRLTLCTMEDGVYESLGSDLFWSATHVHLAKDGASVFGGQYAAGQQLDPICWRITL